jgi:hypothetical protein
MNLEFAAIHYRAVRDRIRADPPDRRANPRQYRPGAYRPARNRNRPETRLARLPVDLRDGFLIEHQTKEFRL